jgi:hypothetical protein
MRLEQQRVSTFGRSKLSLSRAELFQWSDSHFRSDREPSAAT